MELSVLKLTLNHQIIVYDLKHQVTAIRREKDLVTITAERWGIVVNQTLPLDAEVDVPATVASISQLRDIVLENLFITKEQLISETRTTELTDARRIICKLGYELGYKQHEIAKVIQRQRSTVSNHNRDHEGFYESSALYRDKFNKIKDLIA